VVTAFLAATATKVAIYVLLRVFFTIFGAEFSFEALPLGNILMVLAVLAMFTASGVAIFQTNAKRMLAYSSVAQVGYIVLGISMVTVTGVQAGILHLFNHALIKAALFLAMGCVFWRIGSVKIDDLAGLGRRMPWTMAAIVAGGLSLIGIPATAGFVSKWYLILAALEQGWWWVAALILASSLLAVIYVWRLVEAAYLRPPPDGAATGEAPLSMLIPTWSLVAANIWFGIDTRLSAGVAREAAAFLMRGGS
jgi:multicomponent Na+:H+ antiporter subunit D